MTHQDRFALVGNTIAGTFRVDEVVAEGGFGVVYRAFHLHFRSPVALKCLKIPGALSDAERQVFLEQFRSEAEIMFRLSASLPNVVRPLHVDAVHTNSGQFVPLMALEWLEGKTFEKIIEQRTFAGEAPLSLTEVIELLTPAAYALDQAHRFEGPEGTLAIVHRDIKPDNLFLTHVGEQRSVKILDFGISKVRRAATQLAGRISQTDGQAPFSPAYGAPEQWVPKRYGQTGPWTDVWGLALTITEIIKGDAVVIGDHQAMMGTVLDPTVRPTPRNEGVRVTDDIEMVFEKAMAVDPRFRYQTVQAFWEALQMAVRLSGDPTLQPDLDSCSRITLPPMTAPTPWDPVEITGKASAKKVLGRLPPMMAPAPLEKSQPEELAAGASYPNDPSSGLAPVPPAPGSLDDPELEIPALDDEGADPIVSTFPESWALERDRAAHHRSPSSRAPASIDLELEPTSGYPKELDNEAPEVLPRPAPLPLHAGPPRPGPPPAPSSRGAGRRPPVPGTSGTHLQARKRRHSTGS